MNFTPYPYLPDGREIQYVSADNFFMDAARKAVEELSTVSNQKTGAVVVKDGVIIGRGANQSRLKNKKLSVLHQRYCVRKLLHIKTGTRYWLCPGCANFRDHAESRAVFDAKQAWGDPCGADLYLWGHWWCCKPCWDTMIAAGISRVYLLEGSEKLFKKN